MINDRPDGPIYQYWYEYLRDHPDATYLQWCEYRDRHWDEPEWVAWYDDFFNDVTQERFSDI